ncbi:hypothetical protein [Emcibacter sp. SYSU 3D8]|uniref:hypothetical protein n=1 Tax=Emcibacter sp. SYSU 3D8 TaxID=3133969 RepID=UPI0031FE45C6
MRNTKGGGRFAPVLPEAAPDGVTLEERWALARIVATSDLIRLPDGREYLLTPAPAELVDALAAFGAQEEDMEDEGLALDWAWGAPVPVGNNWVYPVIMQDDDREPAYT